MIVWCSLVSLCVMYLWFHCERDQACETFSKMSWGFWKSLASYSETISCSQSACLHLSFDSLEYVVWDLICVCYRVVMHCAVKGNLLSFSCSLLYWDSCDWFHTTFMWPPCHHHRICFCFHLLCFSKLEIIMGFALNRF